MSPIQTFINSLPGQFIIGGLTVSGIAGFSNHLHNPALAGIVASVPIGMPSSIFVSDSEIAEYSWKLLVMTTVLFLATFANWFFITKMKMSKYKSVGISMGIWAGIGAIYYIVSTSGGKK
uniref:Uncharacterized protein n=1 Tax=viral metagenome TaxID=1070528 RepID=A0A6C0CSB8_9ZZZZ